MPKIQDFLDAAYPDGNQRDGGFLLSKDFRSCADLDGSYARKWLEDLGYNVIANGDVGTNGIAVTECGWNLSTNGFIYHKPSAALNYIARLTKKAA